MTIIKRNISEKKFGKLIGIEETDKRSSSGEIIWLMKCNCGENFETIASRVKRGLVTSCKKCSSKKMGRRPKRIKKDSIENHGMCNTAEYRAWKAMLTRCYNKNYDYFKNYGGRRIRVCPEWQKSFIAFYNDMGKKPSSRHSLDRIDNNGDYNKSNCRWATTHEQSLNRTDNFIITYNGRTDTMKGWANRLGMNYGTLKTRIKQLKWPIEKALTTKPIINRL